MHNNHKITNVNIAEIQINIFINRWKLDAPDNYVTPDNADVIISALTNGLPTFPLVMVGLEDGTFMAYDNNTEGVLNVLTNLDKHTKSLSTAQVIRLDKTEFRCVLIDHNASDEYLALFGELWNIQDG